MKKESQDVCCQLRLCNPFLTALTINRSDLDESVSAMQKDTDEIADALQHNDVIRRLNLSCLPRKITTTILDAIRQHPSLEELAISHCQVQGELVDVLPMYLQRLTLHRTRMDSNNNAENLARCIRLHGTLFDLCLTWTDIGVNGAKLIGDSLIATTLQSLSLVRCNIGDAGAVALSQGLSVNVGIKELYLEDNNIGPVGATALARAVGRHPSVRDIWLYNNRIGNEGAAAFGRCLEVNHSLVKLNLDGNKIDTDSVLVLADGLSRNTTLTHLWLFHNSIRDSGAVAMRNALRFNTTLRRISGIMSTRQDARNICDEIYFCVYMNRRGWRKILIADDFAAALWAYVFGVRLRNRPNCIYFFIGERLDLIYNANANHQAANGS